MLAVAISRAGCRATTHEHMCRGRSTVVTRTLTMKLFWKVTKRITRKPFSSLGILLCSSLVVFVGKGLLKPSYVYEYIDLSHLANIPEAIEPVFANITFDELLIEHRKGSEDLQLAGQWRKDPAKPCEEESFAGGACVEASCPVLQSTTPEENLRSVLSTMSERKHKDLSLLMRLFPEPPTGKRTMFVTAASSNHFYEAQALIRNLHRNVFPLIDDYTFVFYDLGLMPWQREQMEKYCRCQVRSYPVEFLPSRLQNLKCYTWKAIIIQANLHKADILVWMDASVRFSNNVINSLLDDVEKRGLAMSSGYNSVAQHTLQITMNYMKENICTLAPVPELQATFIMFHNEQWIREAVVKPWAVCAMSADCMCPRNPERDIFCNVYIHKYNKCNRFDQSAMNIILAKLFRDHTSSFVSTYDDYVAIMRDDAAYYFDELEINA
ncbi:uncharacterized protein LOC124138249 isoform X2 [Haliotis rufescens]|uniref:uncharacterized protein LOC124138249 isoform X2 n=1 Tax=Haliotis rufescens TaxID=6454 RepID=UPI00201F5693|nr:uncharacterized protein LOC124138249 isoform X2 [Haliotis rufescens]